MNVGTILGQKAGGGDVITIESDRTLEDAIARLVEHNIGSLVVMDGGKLAGILTERDILRVSAEGGEKLAGTRVSEAMTKELIVGEVSDAVDYVMGVMTKNRIRHLPIVENEQVCGMISIGDVVKVQLQQTEYENRHLREYIEGSY